MAALLGAPSAVIVLAALGLIALALRGAGPVSGAGVRWDWRWTGATLGIVGVLAWLSGSRAGWHWGLSITGPSRTLAGALLLGDVRAVDWGTAMLVGVPLGTWASARQVGHVRWRAVPLIQLPRRFLGGALMGLGGTLAAGCNIGNALTGLSVLALNSVVATAGIVAGAALGLLLGGIWPPMTGLTTMRNQR